VLHDPFGLRALLHHEMYPAPNRFFAHIFLSVYFRHVPLLLQAVLSPVDSAYAAAAVLKLAIHALLVYVLAVAVSNSRNVLGRKFLLAAVLITPLLQTAGYNGQMGVIDISVTYAVFYALPVALLLLFFLPFLREALHGETPRLSLLSYLGLLGLAIVLAFNGPIVPPTVLIICPSALLLSWHRRFRAYPASVPLVPRAAKALGDIPLPKLVLFLFFSALSLYSLYLGRYNAENLWASLPLVERYARLPLGVFYQLTGKLGFPLLLAMLLLNAWLIRRMVLTALGRRAQHTLKWLGVFSLIFILLLPMGGYRAYREYIIRRDTILPIIVGIIGCFALSSCYLFAPSAAARSPPLRRRPRGLCGVVLRSLTSPGHGNPMRASGGNGPRWRPRPRHRSPARRLHRTGLEARR
jgi:hypothetical protein